MIQVLHNLVHNAMRHSRPGGIVIAAAKSSGDDPTQIISPVCDTGEGIPAATLLHIWQAF